MEQGEKRHKATQHRRDEARKKGQIPKSQDLTSAMLLVGALLAIMYFGPALGDFFVSYARLQLSDAWVQTDRDSIIEHFLLAEWELAHVLLPFLTVLLLLAVGVHLAQVGFVFLPEKLAFDLSRINPLKGASRLLSFHNASRLGFGIFKVVVVSAVAFWSLWGDREQMLTLGMQAPIQIVVFITRLTLWTCLKIAIALLVLAILDYAYQRWRHEQDLRMTDQEMREEMRNMQGDPQVIARRRAVQRQMALNRISTEIPSADVVVTNPTELAIAIKYNMATMEAPVAVAKGAGVLAQKIRRMALENDIPIVERKALARALYKDVDVNQQIPSEQYAAVAEVLKYVYDLKGIRPGAMNAA